MAGDLEAAAPSRRWVSDVSSLLALPAIWMDEEPAQIAASMLDVLFAVLDLDAGYARFVEEDDDAVVERWRPTTPHVPESLRLDVPEGVQDGEPARTDGQDGATTRRGRVSVTLGRTSGLVVVSAARPGFPDPMERQLLHSAAEQAAVAIRAARRLARAHAARRSAEGALERQNRVLAVLLEEVGPQLRGLADRVHAAGRAIGELDAQRADPESSDIGRRAPIDGDSAGASPPLTPREVQVLGLLAQGLSNKEIAGVLRLSHRTVERHLTSLYRKLDVTRRSEATAFALRHGLG